VSAASERSERKQTACRSGRLLTDGVAVRCSASRGTGEGGKMGRFEILAPPSQELLFRERNRTPTMPKSAAAART
jgi:hypothetical protein